MPYDSRIFIIRQFLWALATAPATALTFVREYLVATTLVSFATASPALLVAGVVRPACRQAGVGVAIRQVSGYPPFGFSLP